VYPQTIATFPFQIETEPIKLNGSVTKTASCHRNASKSILITPSFPMSGSGWIQNILYSSLTAAGVKDFHQEGTPHFGFNRFSIGENKFEWLFTHESNDEVWINEAFPKIEFVDRPLIMFRVVRSVLYNVESFYRYSSREQQKNAPDSEPIDFNSFSFKTIDSYREFHTYYTTKCLPRSDDSIQLLSSGAFSESGEFPTQMCCIDVTYEDLQDSFFVRELLRKLLALWLGEFLTENDIWLGVERVTRLLKPLHVPHGQYASGERFTPAHLLQLATLEADI